MLNKLRTRLRALWQKDRMERELDEEMSHHLERQIEQYIAQGMNPNEARLAALRDFGGVEQAKEQCRDARGVSLIEETWQDLRYGARMLVKNRMFAAATIITLALGIGANTAIFSVVYGVLLRPLPYPEPDRLVVLQSRNMRMEYMQSASYQEIRDWRDQSRTLEQASVFADWRSITITGGDRPERVRANVVSPSYLELLGARTHQGRLFTGEDDQMPGAHPVALLSYGLWQRRKRSITVRITGQSDGTGGKDEKLASRANQDRILDRRHCPSHYFIESKIGAQARSESRTIVSS